MAWSRKQKKRRFPRWLARPSGWRRSRGGTRGGTRGGWARTILRWLGIVIAAWIVITALPVIVLRWVDPPITAIMLETRHALSERAGKPVELLHRWVDYARISGPMHLAVVASEDQKFPYHHGFDWESVGKAIEAHREGERLRGASTISQQVAKNLFLWPAHSFVRKGIEAWFTVLIELFWSKQRILEMYLNIAQFGDRLFGVGAAAQHFFGESAAHITRAQAALLAAVLPNPTDRNVANPSAYVRERQADILRQMRHLGTHYLDVIEH